MSTKRIVIVGAGINGLVAANQLARAGHKITLVESETIVGGAAKRGTVVLGDGSKVDYPLGATVLGLMQDFVFKATGLSKIVTIGAPEHLNEYRFAGDSSPTFLPRDIKELSHLLQQRWGEHGDLEAFEHDAGRVIAFLQEGYRTGHAPSVGEAASVLGKDLTRLWITGDARTLLGTYLTSERTKVVYGKGVMESGPVSFREPWSALTLSLTDSGSVLGGQWGYVRGGMWKLVEALAEINRAIGVDVRLNLPVKDIDLNAGRMSFWRKVDPLEFDHVVFATDPVTASQLLGDEALERKIAGKRMLGTSGKLIALFNQHVRWKDDTGLPDYAAGLKFIIAHETLDDLDASSRAAVDGSSGFEPGYYEIYPHGAGNRMLGLDDGRDAVMVFFKHLNDTFDADELDWVHEHVKQVLLSRIANPEALDWSRLLTPLDLTREFGFPRGNIDHVVIGEGQTFMARTYAEDPRKGFYRFGSYQNAWYCGAGAYPCGSVTGTGAWMCVLEMIRSDL